MERLSPGVDDLDPDDERTVLRMLRSVDQQLADIDAGVVGHQPGRCQLTDDGGEFRSGALKPERGHLPADRNHREHRGDETKNEPGDAHRTLLYSTISTTLQGYVCGLKPPDVHLESAAAEAIRREV